MARCDKLLEKAKNAPHNLRFEDLCKLAECYGWVAARHHRTSHRIYFNPNFPDRDAAMMNFQDRGGKAKPTQVKQLLDAIAQIKENSE